MPLFVVSSPSGKQVIVNAASVQEAVSTGNSFVGGPAQARPATAADVQTIPLLGSVIQGDNRPAIEADPGFVSSMGFGPSAAPGATGVETGTGTAGVGSVTNFANAGQTGTALGGTGTGGGGGVPPDVQADLDEALRMSAFSSGMEGRGFNTEGPLGSLLRKQVEPTYANFALDRSFAGNEDTPDANSFRAYVANKGPNAYSDALDLYHKASSAPYGAPSFYDALNRAAVGDTKEQEAYRQNFLNVAQGAARARYSPAAAKFLPNEDTLNRQFDRLLYTEGGKGANAQGVSLLNFLKKQYGF